MKIEATNENGLTVEVLHPSQIKDTNEDNIFGQMGGDSSNPTWEEYLDKFKEEYKPHVKLIRKCIEDNGLIGYTGQDANGWYFKFSDGEIWTYSWRAWGDLMQSIVDKKEGYMKYYM